VDRRRKDVILRPRKGSAGSADQSRWPDPALPAGHAGWRIIAVVSIHVPLARTRPTA